jgi:hypothetical protein
MDQGETKERPRRDQGEDEKILIVLGSILIL